jgi:hypothetical protein
MQIRKWSSKDKLAIVLEGLKGAVPLGELCAKFQISQSQYYKWRDQLLANGPKVFGYCWSWCGYRSRAGNHGSVGTWRTASASPQIAALSFAL